MPDEKISKAHLPVDRIIEEDKKIFTPLENISELAPGHIHSSLIGADATLKAADAGINKMGKVNFQTNKE